MTEPGVRLAVANPAGHLRIVTGATDGTSIEVRRLLTASALKFRPNGEPIDLSLNYDAPLSADRRRRALRLGGVLADGDIASMRLGRRAADLRDSTFGTIIAAAVDTATEADVMAFYTAAANAYSARVDRHRERLRA